MTGATDRTHEIVEAMARAMREEDPIPLSMFTDEEVEDLAQAALTAALPMILKEVAQAVEKDAQPHFRLTAKKIAARIRALAEPKDNGGENG